jgi:hypothetical protein
VLEVLESREHKHLALLGVERGQRSMETLSFVSRYRTIGRMRSLVWGGIQFGGIGGLTGGLVFSEMVRGDLSGEVIDPGGEPALVAVGVPVFEDAIEYELDQVLACRAVAGVAHKKAVQRAMVPFEELAELVDLASADGYHEFVVGEWVHGGRHGINHGRTRLKMQW